MQLNLFYAFRRLFMVKRSSPTRTPCRKHYFLLLFVGGGGQAAMIKKQTLMGFKRDQHLSKCALLQLLKYFTFLNFQHFLKCPPKSSPRNGIRFLCHGLCTYCLKHVHHVGTAGGPGQNLVLVYPYPKSVVTDTSLKFCLPSPLQRTSFNVFS